MPPVDRDVVSTPSEASLTTGHLSVAPALPRSTFASSLPATGASLLEPESSAWPARLYIDASTAASTQEVVEGASIGSSAEPNVEQSRTQGDWQCPILLRLLGGCSHGKDVLQSPASEPSELSSVRGALERRLSDYDYGTEEHRDSYWVIRIPGWVGYVAAVAAVGTGCFIVFLVCGLCETPRRPPVEVRRRAEDADGIPEDPAPPYSNSPLDASVQGVEMERLPQRTQQPPAYEILSPVPTGDIADNTLATCGRNPNGPVL